MSHPSQDPQGYPWGPPSGEGASSPSSSSPGPEPQDDPYGGGQYRGPWTQGAEQVQADQPRSGEPYQGEPYQGQPYRGEQPVAPAAWTGYAGTPVPPPGEGPAVPTSTIVLLVLSGLAVITGAFTIAGVPALVLGIVALTRVRTDPAGARRLTRIGWWVLVGLAVLCVLLVIGAIALLVAFSSYAVPSGGGSPDFGAISAALSSVVVR